jgi:hypothetical protein
MVGWAFLGWYDPMLAAMPLACDADGQNVSSCRGAEIALILAALVVRLAA